MMQELNHRGSELREQSVILIHFIGGRKAIASLIPFPITVIQHCWSVRSLYSFVFWNKKQKVWIQHRICVALQIIIIESIYSYGWWHGESWLGIPPSWVFVVLSSLPLRAQSLAPYHTWKQPCIHISRS